MVFPELCGSVFATNPLQDLLSARVIILELLCSPVRTLRKRCYCPYLCNVVHVALDDDPQRVGLLVLRHFSGFEYL